MAASPDDYAASPSLYASSGVGEEEELPYRVCGLALVLLQRGAAVVLLQPANTRFSTAMQVLCCKVLCMQTHICPQCCRCCAARCCACKVLGCKHTFVHSDAGAVLQGLCCKVLCCKVLCMQGAVHANTHLSTAMQRGLAMLCKEKFHRMLIHGSLRR
jgi:hypothetical protein